MLRRTAWAELGGFLNDFQQAPDYDMWVRLSERFDVGFLPEKLIELRDHPAQLAKVGQKMMTTIEEELPVLRRLENRLADVAPPRGLRMAWLTGRGRQHAQWVARALLRRDLHAVLRGVRGISRYGNPVPQFLYWGLSLNGRLFAPDLHARFDRLARRLDGRS
jgi:hypothetical protein